MVGDTIEKRAGCCSFHFNSLSLAEDIMDLFEGKNDVIL